MTVAPGVLAAVEFQRTAGATSPLLREVLGAVVDDVGRGGPCATVLERVDPTLDPVADAVTLRFVGAVHRIVLDGRAPELAAHYPSVGGSFSPEEPGDIGEAFVAAVAANIDELIEGLRRPVQTNEVGRSAALLPGYLAVAAATGLPLRVLEIGASAGLNLRWDHYRYEGGLGGSAWGDAQAALRFEDVYTEPGPQLAVAATVAERRGCDANPIDAQSDEGRLALRSFVWPDQVERFTRLDAALQIAADVPAVVDRADAGAWIEGHLATPAPGMATVIVHSVVWQYLSPATRVRISEAFDRAARQANTNAPLAWLRMEPGEDFARSAEVRLTTWPGHDARLLAKAGYHGRPVRMLDAPVAPTTS